MTPPELLAGQMKAIGEASGMVIQHHTLSSSQGVLHYTLLRHGKMLADVSLPPTALERARQEDLQHVLRDAYKVIEDVMWMILERHPPETLCIVPRERWTPSMPPRVFPEKQAP